jgi:L-alanine-DL-glutamate epimerase-like enolase superfamily enzyme
VRVAAIETTIVSIPYRFREASAQVDRDGVTQVVVKVTADDGRVGWGESCSGADVASVDAAIGAMVPVVVGREPWARGAIRHDLLRRGLWEFREPTFNFAFAGIDMGLMDLAGQQAGRPVVDLLGGPRRSEVSYYWYLPGASDPAALAASLAEGLAAGFDVFYLKVGVDLEREEAALARVREMAGPDVHLRVDANQAWTVGEAQRAIGRLARFGLDFVEQPVPADPVANMVELRARVDVPLAANEGLWRSADAWEVITRRAADVLCFSPYWVGSLDEFVRLGWAAAQEGLAVCKHTHGELGIAATAGHHALLAMPRIVEGNQHHAGLNVDDVLVDPLPIARGPRWGRPTLPGLGITVDEAKLARWAAHHRERGQYLPYVRSTLAPEDPGWALREG